MPVEAPRARIHWIWATNSLVAISHNSTPLAFIIQIFFTFFQNTPLEIFFARRSIYIDSKSKAALLHPTHLYLAHAVLQS